MKILPFLVAVTLSATAVAQKEAEPAPYPGGPPLTLHAPDKARWSVTVNPSKTEGGQSSEEGGAKKAPAFERRITVIKDQPVVFERIIDPKGIVRDKWNVQGFTFSKGPRDRKHVAYDAPNILGNDYFTNLSKSDFPEFEWISRENYVDTKQVLNQDCLMYQLQGEDGAGAVAYVNARTRYPVLLQKKDDVRVYQFENPPTGSLTLPEDVKEFLDKRAKALKALSK